MRSQVCWISDGYALCVSGRIEQHAKPEEVRERSGADPEVAMSPRASNYHTLDTHMGSLFASPELVEIYQQIGKEVSFTGNDPYEYGASIMAPQLLPYLDTVE